MAFKDILVIWSISGIFINFNILGVGSFYYYARNR